ncbi:MAG: hypothetical protein LBI57_02375 [Helicobacteraceae bacterium]|jgi:hypothetical protein|nr:hypothetical protein [Helicobacteraceae bacterium]
MRWVVLVALAAVFGFCDTFPDLDFKIKVDTVGTKEKIICTNGLRLNYNSRSGGVSLNFLAKNYSDVVSVSLMNIFERKYRSGQYGKFERAILLLDDNKTITINMPRSNEVGQDEYVELGVGSITLQDLEKIANAKKIEVKIVGSDRNETIEHGQIDKNFIPNVKKFLEKIEQ